MSKARQLADLGNVYDDGALSNRSRIINGAMVIDQRNAGASVDTTNTSSTAYTLDRWGYRVLAASKFTIQQNAGSVTPPVGFSSYLGCTSSSTYSVGSGDVFNIWQIVEGYNIADLAFGTASAQSITLSFWVRSSLTGTFSGAFRNGDGTRSYVFTYTINSANVWEYKTVTIAGDQSGTWATDNTAGLFIQFSLGVGSTYAAPSAGFWQSGNYFGLTSATSVVGTNGATFYLTGVQLEVGDTATPFEHRSYGQELALCQRYYTKLGGDALADIYGAAYITGSGFILDTLTLPVKMRAAPTGTKVGTWSVLNVSQPGISYVSTTTFVLYAAGTAIGQGTFFNPALTGYLTFDAEL